MTAWLTWRDDWPDWRDAGRRVEARWGGNVIEGKLLVEDMAFDGQDELPL